MTDIRTTQHRKQLNAHSLPPSFRIAHIWRARRLIDKAARYAEKVVKLYPQRLKIMRAATMASYDLQTSQLSEAAITRGVPVRIITTFGLLMVIGYAVMVLVLPAPARDHRDTAQSSSAAVLSQQAQALSRR